MGTALTGLEIKDTYDGLVKTTDNGPIGATAKYLSDGLGNDSVLALSTAQVGIGTSTTSARLGVDNALNVGVQSLSSDPSAASVFLSNTGTSVGLAIATSNNNLSYLQGRQKTGTGNAFDIALNPLGGNVGIGTSSPSAKLTISTGVVGVMASFTDAVAQTLSLLTGSGFSAINNPSGGDVAIQIGGTERARITSNGLTFNGDTAAANALDDYEEGTWTPSLIFSGGGVGITYNTQAGKYVKVGSKVSVNCYLVLSNKGSSTGNARIEGLPFTIPNANGNYCSTSIYLDGGITYTGQAQGFGNINSNFIALASVSEAGTVSSFTDANFSNSSAIMISLTYLVS
jgi:hypothetical protein